MRRFKFPLVLLMACTICSCTRKSDEVTLKLSFAKSASAGNSSQSLVGNLEVAIINIQLPSGPFVKQFDFKDAPIAAGQSFSLEVPNVPKGSYLVQFLGVYKDPNTALRVFAYGDTPVNATGSISEANITAVQIGSTVAEEGRVVGRYFNTATGGPTGQLEMRFQPPSGKPVMAIERHPIVDGWFSLMVLDNTPMDYVLLGSPEQVIFQQIKLAASSLIINGVASTPGPNLVQFAHPKYFRKNNSVVEIQPPSELFLGYFEASGLGTVSSKKVCYASPVVEAIPGAFQDAAFTQPLEISTSSPTTTQVRVIGGGSPSPVDQTYTETSTGCTTTNAQDHMFIYHTLLDSSDNVGGYAPPFKAISPFSRSDKYLQTDLQVSGGPVINIHWSFIPGLTSVAGTTVFAKYSATMATSGMADGVTCDTLTTQGYREVANVSFPTTSYAFTDPTLTVATKWNWQYALCGYRLNSVGQREFVGQYVSGHGANGSDSLYHAGWAPSTKTLTGASSESYGTYGGIQRIVSVDATSSPLYTTVTLDASFSSVQPGDEVMFHVAGASGNAPCGLQDGSPIGNGAMDFARVIAISGTSLKVDKGSFLEQLSNANLAAIATANSTFCYVHALKVLQYRDVNLTSTSQFIGGTSGFNYSGGTGYLPMRVNGTLTFGAITSFNADFGGYFGGAATSSVAAGDAGAQNSSTATGSGGGFLNGGAGGAGSGGNGGAGSNGAQAGVVSNGSSGGIMSLMFGGGGGGSSPAGGNGGGLVFLIARNLIVPGTSVISANGGAGSSGTFASGGGGGGSVFLVAHTVSGTGSISLNANGGNGGSTTGGVGGGGWISAVVCDKSGLSGGVTSQVAAGATGTTTGAMAGIAALSDPSNGNYSYICGDSQ